MDSEQKTSGQLLPVLAALGAMLFWGLSFVSSKAILNTGYPPMTMVFLRFLIASLVLIPLQRRLDPEFRLQKQDRLFLLLSALFGIFFYFLCESRGIKYTSASNAALITAIIPALTVAAEYLLFRNSIRWFQGTGIALSIVGVYFVVQRTPGHYDSALLGNLLMFGACLSWVAYNMFSKNLHKGLRGINLITFQSVIGMILLLPVALSEARSWSFGSLTVWLNLVYLGVICTALSFFLYLYALAKLGPVRVTSFINLLPVVSVVGGMAILGERLLLAQMIGGGVIIFGVFLVNRPGRARVPARG
ncbi:MAG: DMT family transporter [Spirochaetaceae bacterium]|nr:MAG: DMT family transporter [Spirochaetaceae bacterium]